VYGQIEEGLKNPPPAGVVDDQQSRLFSWMERLVTWSRRWMEAELDASDREADKIAAIEGHVKRLKKWEDEFAPVAQGEPAASRLMLDTLRYHRLEGEYWLAKAKAER
jgi:hypothetical protein